MKKSKVLVMIFTALFFASCKDPIFYEVMKDVEPTKATVFGNINSITRYCVEGEEFLVLNADGGIRYKRADNEGHGNWKTYSNLPFSFHKIDEMNSSHKGHQIIKILADKDTLYLVTATYKDGEDNSTIITDKIHLWAKKMTLSSKDSWKTDGEFTEIINSTNSNNFFYTYFVSSIDKIQKSDFNVFQTNSIKKENRKVFIRNKSGKDAKYYELSGLNEPTEISIPKGKIIDSNSDETKNTVNSAIWFDGEVKFFNSKVSTTNETCLNDATYFYFTNGNRVRYGKSTTNLLDSVDVGTEISGFAVCSDSLLIGRADFNSTSSVASGGIVKTLLKDGIPGDKLVNFDNNAQFQLPSTYLMTALINATPEKTEKESILYAAITIFGQGTSSNVSWSNVGLWSYYKDRGNWNRE